VEAVIEMLNTRSRQLTSMVMAMRCADKKTKLLFETGEGGYEKVEVVDLPNGCRIRTWQGQDSNELVLKYGLD
jgi:hypothetical protein